MANPWERVCCHKLSVLDYDGQSCYSLTERFETVCLNEHVLRAAISARNDYLQMGTNPNNNESMRHLAYRQFIYDIFGRLGRGVRTVIPACSVTAIRNRYPGSTYTGFRAGRVGVVLPPT